MAEFNQKELEEIALIEKDWPTIVYKTLEEMISDGEKQNG